MFQPWSFSPLVLRPALWLDASDASTLWNATSGGALTAADGAVARWEDKSGNARHATQATGVSQPLRKTNIKNGRDAVRFDGSNDFLSSSLTNDGNCTIFVVSANKNATIGASEIDYLIGFGPFPNAPNNKGIALNTANAFASTTQRYLLSEGIPAGSLVTYKNSNSFTGLGATITLNEFTCFSAKYSGVTGEGSKTLVVGRLVITGAATYYGNNDIAEILVFPTVLSDADRQAVESYLNTKWAIY